MKIKKPISRTGGGPYEYNEISLLEDITIQAAGLHAQVDGIEVPSFGVGCTSSPTTPVSPATVFPEIEENPDFIEIDSADEKERPHKKIKKNNKVDNDMEAIKSFYKDIRANLKTLVEIQQVRLDIEKRKLEIMEAKFNLKY